ncbi:hypothetical protein BH746_11870 [Enterococcus faecalis]|nr:hypothetical protein BH746_11870 [Enterococcus faecalis]
MNKGPSSVSFNQSETINRVTKTLPKTSSLGINHWLIVGGTVLSIMAILLFLWKRKRLKQLFFIILAINGLSLMKPTKSYAISQDFLKPTEIKYILKGTALNEQPPVIDGYTYVGYLHTYRNQENPQPTPIEKGQVEIRYQSVRGKTLADSVVLKGTIGEPYQAKTEEIDGYVQKEVHGSAVGVFKTEKQVVTFIYEEIAAPVTIRYVDDQGEEIADKKVLRGTVDQIYDTTTADYQLNIEGYVLNQNKLPTNATGSFTNQTQTVTYVYQKESQDAKLIVKFINTTGEPFIISNLTTLKNGDFVPLYPNLEKYTVRMEQEIAGKTYSYQQNQVVAPIELEKKIGDAYELPKRIRFTIQDEKGLQVDYLISENSNGSSSGIQYWGNYSGIPENYQGIIQDKEVIVTYKIKLYTIYFPEP